VGLYYHKEKGDEFSAGYDSKRRAELFELSFLREEVRAPVFVEGAFVCS